MLIDEIPSVELLLSLAPEELAPVLLKQAVATMQNGIFQRPGDHLLYPGPIPNSPEYPRGRADEIEIAVAEAWGWLEINLLVVPAPGINGTNGFRVLSRRGAALLRNGKFDEFRRAAEFPKSLLHPLMAEKCGSTWRAAIYLMLCFLLFEQSKSRLGRRRIPTMTLQYR